MPNAEKMALCKSLRKQKLGSMGSEMISVGVGVGDKHRTFSIHKALLQKHTKHFDADLASEAGRQGLIFLNDVDPEAFKMFYEWIYTGTVAKPPTKFSVSTVPPESEMKQLEDDLRARFDAHEVTLVSLYCLGEQFEIKHLMNRAIDAIQDGFFEYGTVFGPGLINKIFWDTKRNSQLRELCVGTILIHLDRGCCQLRQELMSASMLNPDVFSVMLRWISRNFHLFGRRQREGYDVTKPKEGFSLLNRKKLCPCHFHTHGPKDAHKDHDKCAVPFKNCGHEGEDQSGEVTPELDQRMSELLAALMRGPPNL